MAAPCICWRRIEARLIRLAGLHGLGEGVVDFEDSAFGLGDDFAEVLPVQVKM